MGDQRCKVLLLRCVCRKVTGQQKESVYSSPAWCTLGIVTESTNSCEQPRRQCERLRALARSRCLQERTRWPLLHQCLHKEEAHLCQSNSACCHTGRMLIDSLQLLGFLLSNCTRWQQDTGFFNQFKVHSLYVIIGIVCGNGLTYPSMPKRK